MFLLMGAEILTGRDCCTLVVLLSLGRELT